MFSSIEFWIFIGTQLMTYGALRQQVKDLGAAMIEEKREREKLEERVRELEMTPQHYFVKKIGG